jgi:hypothetical protein
VLPRLDLRGGQIKSNWFPIIPTHRTCHFVVVIHPNFKRASDACGATNALFPRKKFARFGNFLGSFAVWTLARVCEEQRAAATAVAVTEATYGARKGFKKIYFYLSGLS